MTIRNYQYVGALRNTEQFTIRAFTLFGYADGVAAGRHTLSSNYGFNGSSGGPQLCVADSAPWTIQIEGIF